MIVYAGTDPLTGRRLRLRQTVKTEEQAHILLGKMLEQVAEGKQRRRWHQGPEGHQDTSGP